MDLVGILFGRPPAPHAALPVIAAAPPKAAWRRVRPRAGARPVRAQLARRDGVLKTSRGEQRYRAGAHYIVGYGKGERSVVRRDVFEAIYAARPDGAYEKRGDLILRYFTLAAPAIVQTLEGPERANAGDWVMEGPMGELYPMSPARGRRFYEPVEDARDGAEAAA
jgi:hypothetical protein